MAPRLPHRQVCDGASSARPCSEIRASRLPSPWLPALLTAQHKSLRLQPLQLILNSPDLGVQETAQDPAREGLPQRPTRMLGLVGAFTAAKATLRLHKCSHGLVCHLRGTWSWSRSWEKPAAVSESASWSSAATAVSALHPLLAQHGRLKHCHSTPHTAHGPVTTGAGEGSGPASPAVSPPGPSHAGLPSPSPCHLCGQLRLEVLGAHSVWPWSAGSEGHFWG